MTQGVESYGIGPESYLARARRQLLLGTDEALFYAVYELRCCIEVRQAEYAEAFSTFDSSQIRPWKIGETRKRIEKISAGKLISQFLVNFDDGVRFEIYHTPVPQALSDFVEKQSGDLLHAQKQYRPSGDFWWEEIRKEVQCAYRAAWLACQGNALAPPLWNPKTGQTYPLTVEQKQDSDVEMLKRLAGSVGKSMNVHIDYLDTAPPHWVCDL